MTKLLLVLLAGYLLVVLGMTLAQRKLMYFPHTDLGPPIAYGLQAFKADTLVAEDGVHLTYWYAPPANGKPTILYLHGNAGHLGHRTGFYALAQQMGFGVFALSYRGFGTSQGTISEQGFYADGRAALDALRTRYHTADTNIILYGESIGTGVATELARNQKFRCMVLQAPFTSAMKRAAELYAWLPVKYIMWDKFDSLSKSKEIKSPVLVLVGEADQLILPEDSQTLFDAIPVAKKLQRFPGIGHNDFPPELTLKALQDFDRNQCQVIL